MGIEIVDSIDELLKRVDVVLLDLGPLSRCYEDDRVVRRAQAIGIAGSNPAPCPLEVRGSAAAWSEGRLVQWLSSQGVQDAKNAIVATNGLPRWLGWPLIAAYAWFVGRGLVACSPTAAAMALDDFPDRGLFVRTIPSDSLQAAAIASARST